MALLGRGCRLGEETGLSLTNTGRLAGKQLRLLLGRLARRGSAGCCVVRAAGLLALLAMIRNEVQASIFFGFSEPDFDFARRVEGR